MKTSVHQKILNGDALLMFILHIHYSNINMEFGASHQATTINCDMLMTNKQNHKFAVVFTYTCAVECTEM